MKTRIEFTRGVVVRVWEGDLPVIPEGQLVHCHDLGVAAARISHARIELRAGGAASQYLEAK